MNRSTYKPRKPTAKQKQAAHDFYAASLPDDSALVTGSVPDLVSAQMPAFPAPSGAPAQPDCAETVLRGLLRTPEAVREYITGGRATITVVSHRSGTRFTFKFRQAKEGNNGFPLFVDLLSGPDNTADYVFLGTVWPEDTKFHWGPLVFRHSHKSVMNHAALSVKAAAWLVSKAARDASSLQQAEVWHEGRCGRCGRKLTVPSSIESGIGPECAKKEA